MEVIRLDSDDPVLVLKRDLKLSLEDRQIVAIKNRD